MNETVKSWLVGVATALSVSAITAVGSVYVDVQLLKKDQEQQQKYNEEQGQMKEVLNRLDKSIAVQAEAFKTLTASLEELKKKEGLR